jgi:large subunit ribosomal protein L18
MASTKIEGRKRRKLRIRKKVNGTPERPRLSVFRSARHIYAQVIDDTTGRTLVSASTLCKDFKAASSEPAAAPEATPDKPADKGKKAKASGKIAVAMRVGQLLAERCKAQSIGAVVFDRNGYLYHGRVRALAEAARKSGLDF